MQPIYTATSQESAVIVSNFPAYGKRNDIRYWLEEHPYHGYRFAFQQKGHNVEWDSVSKIGYTKYTEYAAGMFLDLDQDTISWYPISSHSSLQSIEQFFEIFTEFKPSKEFRLFLAQSRMRCERQSRGEAVDGKPQRPTLQRIDRAKHELVIWDRVFKMLVSRT